MGYRTLTVEERLRRALGDELLTGEPLRHHTTFRIGGPADFYFAARTSDQLLAALRVAHEIELPVFLLGGGSNLLVSDDGFRGLVLRNAIETVEFDGSAALVGGGADFLDLIYQCRDRGLAGLEVAAGTSARSRSRARSRPSMAPRSRRSRAPGSSSPTATRASSAIRGC
jgi:UDP-N-acetylmuramate dehydrogenase